MTRLYENAVFDVYGRDNAKTQLVDAIKNIRYEPKYRHQDGRIYIEVDCSISYANTAIDLYHSGPDEVDKEGDIPEYDTKRDLLKELTDSPAYKFIMYDCDVIAAPNKFL